MPRETIRKARGAGQHSPPEGSGWLRPAKSLSEWRCRAIRALGALDEDRVPAMQECHPATFAASPQGDNVTE